MGVINWLRALGTAGLALPVGMLLFGWYRSLYRPGPYGRWLGAGLLLAALFGYYYAGPVRYPAAGTVAGLLVPPTFVVAFGLVNWLSERLNGRPFILPNRPTMTPAERTALNASDLAGYALLMLASYGMFFYWSVQIGQRP
ncbi:hypothetical protein ACFQ48_00570 [Hymenobacter caeli]|uniref:Uncharacterized protein n=1 Tax=Hymenobacter caeli TaxID=2735894 RepID=A0ABX2FKE3_9BACT|nr:hypothetical protein [Hymenobacter caeli]NRT17313.1 hypothetical protein [Hymenobacter caeli]